MSVLSVLEWIMTSQNIITCWLLVIFAFSLLWILIRGVFH